MGTSPTHRICQNVRRAPLRDALADATGRMVTVDNDASVATRGEVTYGAATGKRDVVLVTLGTGIGGGFLLDGRMYRGAHNFGAEVGHFTVDINGPLCACGERGHWEAIASGTALGRLARELVSKGGGAALVAAAGGDASAVTGMHVGAAAARGDPDARSLLVQYAENVAVGLAGLANLLDPECIVIAGGLVELGALLFEPLREAFGRHIEGVDYRPAISIVPAMLGERAGAIGAAVLAAGCCREQDPVMTVLLGVTLPSFVEDPEIPITVARAAEAAELDGVFVYDHVWRGDPPNRRPALECLSLLGAVAAETIRIRVGTLVARATLRPAATLANAFSTAQRVSNGRLVAGIGAGDSQSREENEAFGLEFGTIVDRVAALHDAVRAASGKGFPVWVGGHAAQVREIVAVADGWNSWGTTPEEFASQGGLVRAVAPGAVLTWGGLARPIDEGAVALTDRLRPYAAAGAAWIIVGPVDASDPANASVLAEVRAALNP